MTPFATRTLLAAATCGFAAPTTFAQSDFFFTADNGTSDLTVDDTIRRSNGGDGTVVTALPTTDPRTNPSGPADIDLIGGTLYFSDFGRDGIFSLPTTGGTPTQVVDIAAGIGGNPSVFGIAGNSTASTFYFGDGGTDIIYSATSGTVAPLVNLVTTFGAGSYNPRGIALDEVNGKVYWSDVTTDGIYRVNTDGTNPELLFATSDLGDGNTTPNSIDLDVAGNRLFVGDSDDFIATAALDGTGASVLVDLDASGFLSPDGSNVNFTLDDVDYLAGRLHVADSSNGVYSLDASTGAGLFLEANDLRVRGVAVAAIPEPATAAVLAVGGLALLTRRSRAAA